MKELSKKRLLEHLELWHEITSDVYLLEDDEPEEDKQAYDQIRKLIEDKPKMTREEIANAFLYSTSHKLNVKRLIDLLKSKGVEVED